MNGAFLMSREIFEHNVFTDIKKFRIFFWIIGHAVFSEQGVSKGGVRINRGQYLRSYRNLREDLVYFEKNAEKYYALSTIKEKIQDLVKEGSLTIEETKLGTLFTVVNYEQYQGFERYKNTEKEEVPNTKRTPTEQQTNGYRTANEQQPNNNNLGIKDIKDLPTTTTKRQGSSGPTDYQRRLLYRYVELRGSGLFHSPKDQQEAAIIEQAGVPFETAISILESKFAEFTPRHAKDKINSLSYCTGAILDAYYRDTHQQGSADEPEKQETNQPRYNYGY